MLKNQFRNHANKPKVNVGTPPRIAAVWIVIPAYSVTQVIDTPKTITIILEMVRESSRYIGIRSVSFWDTGSVSDR